MAGPEKTAATGELVGAFAPAAAGSISNMELPKMQTEDRHFPAVREGQIGGTEIQTVDARELHAFMQVGKDFSTWIRDRIGQFGFVDGADFVSYEDLISPISGRSKARDRIGTEYRLSIDMAKELAMVERNAQGKKARQHFIECERRLLNLHRQPIGLGTRVREAVTVFSSYKRLARMLGLEKNQALIAANHATLKRTGENMLVDLGSTHLLAPEQFPLLTPTQLGERLGGLSGRRVNLMLAEAGLQAPTEHKKGGPAWEPTPAGASRAKWMDTGKKHGDGTPVQQLKWTGDVLALLGKAAA